MRRQVVMGVRALQGCTGPSPPASALASALHAHAAAYRTRIACHIPVSIRACEGAQDVGGREITAGDVTVALG